MTFVDDVAALRRLLGVAMHLELQPAILAMSLAMGLEGGGSLPDQVAKLVAATGMAVDTPAPVEVATAAPAVAAPATASDAAPEAVGSMRKANPSWTNPARDKNHQAKWRGMQLLRLLRGRRRRGADGAAPGGVWQSGR